MTDTVAEIRAELERLTKPQLVDFALTNCVWDWFQLHQLRQDRLEREWQRAIKRADSFRPRMDAALSRSNWGDYEDLKAQFERARAAERKAWNRLRDYKPPALRDTDD